MKNLLFCVFCLSLFSCAGHYDKVLPDPAPSVYFWRTVFRLDPTEMKFLRIHGVKKMYVRFFDVEPDGRQQPMPVGTIRFVTPVPKDIKVIPVVYVEHTCLQHVADLAEKIVKRVSTMAETNNLSINELQIDCDWTISTQKEYFDLLRKIRTMLAEKGTYLLSTTIRLHQLSAEKPPVDYGVLMCYNTGNLRDYLAVNSILSEKDVRPYLSQLRKYSLPLCVAYPVFDWKLLFERGQFRAILREADLSDPTLYRRKAPHLYQVVRTHSLASPDPESFGLMLRVGDEVKVDEVTASDILHIQSLIEEERPEIHRQVVIYSLNSPDINKIKPYEMDQIYHR